MKKNLKTRRQEPYRGNMHVNKHIKVILQLMFLSFSASVRNFSQLKASGFFFVQFEQDSCNMLWCSERKTPHMCRTKRGPPLPGSSCGHYRVGNTTTFLFLVNIGFSLLHILYFLFFRKKSITFRQYCSFFEISHFSSNSTFSGHATLLFALCIHLRICLVCQRVM